MSEPKIESLKDLYDIYYDIVPVAFEEFQKAIVTVAAVMEPYKITTHNISICDDMESIVCYFANADETLRIFIDLSFGMPYNDMAMAHIASHKGFQSSNGSLEKCMRFCQQTLNRLKKST